MRKTLVQCETTPMDDSIVDCYRLLRTIANTVGECQIEFVGIREYVTRALAKVKTISFLENYLF